MSAAILQGVPATTLDTDLWIDLPERQYVKVLDICKKQGGTVMARTVVALSDDTTVDFLYRIDGLPDFEKALRKAKRVRWLGLDVPVVPLESIMKSKKFVGRPKYLAHIPLIEQILAAQKAERKRQKRKAKS